MTTTQTQYIHELGSLIAGLQKHDPNLVTKIHATSYSSAQLVQLLEALIASTSSVIAAKTAWHDAAQANWTALKRDGGVVPEIRHMLLVMYGKSESVLADYGLSPKKVAPPLTTPQRAERAAKARATRVVRGTTSKKQKAALTGNVTGVTITPVPGPVPGPKLPSSDPG